MTIKPMLADQIKAASPEQMESQLMPYAAQDNYWFEQKCDGDRLLVTVGNGTVQFLNRNGEQKTTLPTEQKLRAVFEQITAGSWCFDGELVDGVLWLFDMPHAGSQVSHSDPYEWRRTVLGNLHDRWKPDPDVVQLLPFWTEKHDKLRVVDRMRALGKEGVMVKDVAGRYEPGKRSRHVLKAKFYNTIDVIVSDTVINGKENAELSVVAEQGIPDVVIDGVPVNRIGKCSTIGKPAVKPGDVIEVKYLYAVEPKRPRLYQPTILTKRDDKPAVQCTADQLVYSDKSVVPAGTL